MRNSTWVFYAKGEGVPEDDRDAVKWYRLAAEQGHASAQFNRGYMYDKAKPDACAALTVEKAMAAIANETHQIEREITR